MDSVLETGKLSTLITIPALSGYSFRHTWRKTLNLVGVDEKLFRWETVPGWAMPGSRNWN